MPRKPLIRTSEYPYHVMSRTNNHEWFQISMMDCWKVFEKYLYIVETDFRLQVIAFVLMSNHFHLLAFTPEANLDEIMHYLLREVSKTLGIRSGRKNHAFGRPYKWTVIDTPTYLACAYKYIYRNPIGSGQVQCVENYPYSTYYFLENNHHLKFKIHDDFSGWSENLIPKDMIKRREWLNTSYEAREGLKIKHALKRRVFHFPKRIKV